MEIEIYIFIYLFLNKRADFEVNPAPMGIITFIYYFCLLFLAMSFAINWVSADRWQMIAFENSCWELNFRFYF